MIVSDFEIAIASPSFASLLNRKRACNATYSSGCNWPMHGRDDDDACHCKDRECDGSICIHLLLFSPAAPTLAGPPYDDDDCAFFAQLF